MQRLRDLLADIEYHEIAGTSHRQDLGASEGMNADGAECRSCANPSVVTVQVRRLVEVSSLRRLDGCRSRARRWALRASL